MSREDVELVRRVYEADGPFWLPMEAHEEAALNQTGSSCLSTTMTVTISMKS